MQRKRMLLVAALTGAALVLTACTAGGGGYAKKALTKNHADTTVSLWTAWAGTNEKQFQELANTCTAKYPWLHVNITSKEDNLADATSAAVSAGNPPDLVEFRDPDQLGLVASAHLLEPLNKIAKRDGFTWNQFVPAMAKESQFQGTYYSVPYAFDVYGLYYNKKMLAAAGITKPPTTLAEIDAINDKLTKKNPDGSLSQVGFLPDYAGSYLFNYSSIWGVNWFTKNGVTPTYANGGKLAGLLQWERSFYTKYGVNALRSFKASFGKYDSAKHPLMTGKVAMAYDGEWLSGYPKLFGTTASTDWGVVPMPGPDGVDAQNPVSMLAGNALAIPTGSAHPEEAWTLLKCMTTNAKALARFNSDVSNISALTAAQAYDPRKNDPVWSEFLHIATSTKAVPPPTSVAGNVLADPVAQFEEKYLAGNIPNLAAGLAKAQQNTVAQIKQTTGK